MRLTLPYLLLSARPANKTKKDRAPSQFGGRSVFACLDNVPLQHLGLLQERLIVEIILAQELGRVELIGAFLRALATI